MQWLEIILLAIVLVGLVALFAKGIIASAQGDVTKCATAVDAKSPIGPFLALIAISGFAIGRAVANARKWIHQAPPVTDSKVVRTDGWLQGSLTLFLVMAAVLLGLAIGLRLSNGLFLLPLALYMWRRRDGTRGRGN